VEIVTFSPEHEADVLRLIVEIQRNEFSIEITADQQPDLRTIPEYYQTGTGNFWVALADSTVVGTISLLDIGDNQAALRKMFVHRDFRGSSLGTSRQLLNRLLTWAKGHHLREIFLGTTPFFLAAHRFYEKNSFTEIDVSRLPAAFPIMKVDTKFYRLTLSDDADTC